MKKHNYIFLFILIACVSITNAITAQETKTDLLLSVSYYNSNNTIQYIKAKAKTKIDGKFQMVPGIHLNFYIADESPANLLGKGITNDKGEAILLIPPTAKEQWTKAAKQSFLVASEATKSFDATKANADVTKAKIKMDTTSDRKITATLVELKDSAWVPVKGVDLKVAVKRLDGDLNVNETPTYTTDSLGMVTAEFKRDSLPGDTNGNLVLIAKVEDNDMYGNISAEKTVPWGASHVCISNFNKRTLFARRGQSPVWLELMAYSIVIAVWGILLYLFAEIKKIKSLGTTLKKV